jgi:hypothetical protein
MEFAIPPIEYIFEISRLHMYDISLHFFKITDFKQFYHKRASFLFIELEGFYGAYFKMTEGTKGLVKLQLEGRKKFEMIFIWKVFEEKKVAEIKRRRFLV